MDKVYHGIDEGSCTSKTRQLISLEACILVVETVMVEPASVHRLCYNILTKTLLSNSSAPVPGNSLHLRSRAMGLVIS